MKKLLSVLFVFALLNCEINDPVVNVKVQAEVKAEVPTSTPVNTIVTVQYVTITADAVIQTSAATNPVAPYAPTLLATTSTNAVNTLSWQESSGATSYTLYFSVTSGATKATATPIQGAVSPYLHTGLTNGTKYYYFVTATSNALESVESAEIVGVPGLVDNHDGSIFVYHLNQTWQKCSDNYYNALTDSCNATAMPTHQYCAANDNTCDDGTVLISGDVFNTCATLAINGGGWRVPTVAEMQAFQPYASVGVIDDWHWASDAVPFQMVSMQDGLSRLPIWRNQYAYVNCVK